MTDTARHVIESFEALPETEKREVIAVLLRQALQAPYESPGDDELTHAADQVFLELDERERSS
ncbi:hypothetical protein FBQ97_20225 [Acidobacteria bacterium ACD]|nr:hypothetical protein [Acidobacteria bacterium ACD]